MSVLPIWIIAFIVVSTFHEYAHAWAAYKLGDDTAYYAGRLTLNPLPHIDPIGIFVLIMSLVASGGSFAFGWAKPVPFNPYRLRNPQRDTGLIAIAGPISNIIQASVFSVVFKVFEQQIMASQGLFTFFYIFILLNIILAGFNLIPIPPLDGSKVLFSLLPRSMLGMYAQFERYSFIIFMIVMFTPVRYVVFPMFITPLIRGFNWVFDLPFF